ncbi:MAG: response regulator [Desulfonatronovibrio sp. MSAO_Bac4]|nr:MAG: response regulator [Desulfonatronovibrio sp. MSAO_Bac4]
MEDLGLLKKIKMMIVDDEERFLSTLAKRLAEKGVYVETASSGFEALEKIRDKSMDIVVLDIKMPQMDGIQTLGHIKKIDSDIEVILLTGHANVESAVEGMRLGAHDYLMKPCDLELLIEKVLDAFNKKAGREDKRIRDHVSKEMEHWQKHWSRQ